MLQRKAMLITARSVRCWRSPSSYSSCCRCCLSTRSTTTCCSWQSRRPRPPGSCRWLLWREGVVINSVPSV